MRPVNDGSRVSRLEQGRRLVGEVAGEVDPEFAAAIRGVRVEPFDFVALQAHAARLTDDAPPPPRAPRRPWWALLPVALGVAAAVFLAFPGSTVNRLKGTQPDLDFYVLRDGQPLLGDRDAAYRAGDRLQFNYLAGGYESLVLLSVDGDGVSTVYFPAAGDDPVPLTGGGRHVLDASIILDDAPGPEVFLAFFGEWTVREALARAEASWESGGTDALTHLDVSDPSIVSVVLEKE